MTDASRGIAELRAAADALQTSLENLDAELYPELGSWSDSARQARERALREWAETARHMETIIAGLEQRNQLS